MPHIAVITKDKDRHVLLAVLALVFDDLANTLDQRYEPFRQISIRVTVAPTAPAGRAHFQVHGAGLARYRLLVLVLAEMGPRFGPVRNGGEDRLDCIPAWHVGEVMSLLHEEQSVPIASSYIV
jgi:hypothetical protein